MEKEDVTTLSLLAEAVVDAALTDPKQIDAVLDIANGKTMSPVFRLAGVLPEPSAELASAIEGIACVVHEAQLDSGSGDPLHAIVDAAQGLEKSDILPYRMAGRSLLWASQNELKDARSTGRALPGQPELLQRLTQHAAIH
jgi:hypothetical protein